MEMHKWCMKHLSPQLSTSLSNFFTALLDHVEEQDKSSRRLLDVWLLHASMNSGCGTALDFSGHNHLHGCWHVTMMFEFIIPIVAHTQEKCGPNASEEGWFLINVYFCSSHAFVKLVPSSRQEAAFYSDAWDLSLTFPSFQYHKYVPKVNSGEGQGWISCMSSESLKIRLQMHVQIHHAFPSHRAFFSPLYTFFLPDFILPRKVRSHLKFLQCTCDWQNICPGNVLISPQLINTSFSWSLNPQVPLKLWFSWPRIDEEKFEM